MVKTHGCIQARSPIIYLDIVKNNLVTFITKLHGVKFFAQESCEITLNLSNQELSAKTTAVTLSPDGNLLAFANKNIIYIVSVTSHKITKKINTNSTYINLLIFDASSKYIISGDRDGRVIQYKHNSNSAIARLCSFPYLQSRKREKQDTVSAFAHFENFIACSGYNGNIIVTNIFSRTNKTIITSTKVRSHVISFIDTQTLISADIDGVVHILSLADKRIHHKINTTFRDICNINFTKNPQYILVNGHNNYISLLDIQNFKVINHKYLQFQEDIDHVKILNNRLYIAFKNATIQTMELPNESLLDTLVNNNALEDACKLIQSSPTLQGSLAHQKVEQYYKKSFSQAVNAITNNQKELAKKLISPFTTIPSKKDEINNLFKSFEHFNRFQALIYEKKYALAYAMAAKYPAFTYTNQYNTMEKAWKKSFADAQRQMILGRDDIAKAILSEYMTVTSKQALIKFILQHSKTFLDFLKAIEHKEYKKIYEIIKKSEVFKQIPNFITLNNEIEKDIVTLQNHIQMGDTRSATKCLLKLKPIPHLNEQLQQYSHQCNAMIQLKKAYRENYKITC